MSQRIPGHQHHAIPVEELLQRGLRIVRMRLHLHHLWSDLTVVDDVPDQLLREIGKAQSLYLACLAGLFHGTVARKIVSDRLMEDEKVHVIRVQSGQGVINGLCPVLILSGPQLCHQENVLSLHSAFPDTSAHTDAASVIEEAAAYTVYELAFERDGMQIYGNLYLPKSEDEQYPTAIIGHEFGSSYSYMAPYAAILAENGIASYVFDFCGGSPDSRSDGDPLQMSVFTEREDMEAVLEGIQAYRFVDRENIFLMGESQGGLVAALLAASRPEDVRGLALLYPALVIPDNAREWYMDESDIPETAQVFGTPVGEVYFTDIFQMDVYDEIGNFNKNVLIVHGSDDSIVPISYSERAVEVYPSAELIVMDGAGHGFYGVDRENAAMDIVGFLQQNTLQSTDEATEGGGETP